MAVLPSGRYSAVICVEARYNDENGSHRGEGRERKERGRRRRRPVHLPRMRPIRRTREITTRSIYVTRHARNVKLPRNFSIFYFVSHLVSVGRSRKKRSPPDNEEKFSVTVSACKRNRRERSLSDARRNPEERSTFPRCVRYREEADGREERERKEEKKETRVGACHKRRCPRATRAKRFSTFGSG